MHVGSLSPCLLSSGASELCDRLEDNFESTSTSHATDASALSHGGRGHGHLADMHRNLFVDEPLVRGKGQTSNHNAESAVNVISTRRDLEEGEEDQDQSVSARNAEVSEVSSDRSSSRKGKRKRQSCARQDLLCEGEGDEDRSSPLLVPIRSAKRKKKTSASARKERGKCEGGGRKGAYALSKRQSHPHSVSTAMRAIVSVKNTGSFAASLWSNCVNSFKAATKRLYSSYQ